MQQNKPRFAAWTLITAAFLSNAQAQWALQESPTKASLRGIHSLGGGVAWASGANGIILRTVDDGHTWQTCTTPPNAEKLDFRGVQAFDSKTAIVMSAGTGELSRLYKTTDGCNTWKLVLTNADKEGFWDAIQFSSPDLGVLTGDQVNGLFPILFSTDRGNTWINTDRKGIPGEGPKQSIFAASNSSLLIDPRNSALYLLTGGGITSLIQTDLHLSAPTYIHVPLATGESAGGFSVAARIDGSNFICVAVGGDYKFPENAAGTAAFFADSGWQAARTSPHGYRSAVAWYAPANMWIAVGTNGTDISTDDGRNWRSAPDTVGNWNALSLPFVVGSGGRIGKLIPSVMQ